MLTNSAERPVRFGFLLLPGFPLMSYASAVEPLRAANHLSGKRLYEWRHLSFDGAPLSASNGIAFAAEARLEAPGEIDTLLVCAGGNPAKFDHPPTFAHLRALGMRGVRIGGMSGGAYMLARAGLLDGHRCTVHWEHIPAFVEEFPNLIVERTLFVIDRGRITCAGGTASLDMMLALIAEGQGAALSTQISEWYLHTRTRAGTDSQRMALRERTGIANPRLLKALAAMESHVEAPLSRVALAKAAGVTVRQLERLFLGHLSTTIAKRYGEIRLIRARALLKESALPVAEVAMACGFVSTSHFAKAYRAQFGIAPRDERRAPSRHLPDAASLSYKKTDDPSEYS